MKTPKNNLRKVIVSLTVILALSFSQLAVIKAFSQGAAINTNGANPHPSAILDISSSTQGILIPRMTEAERAAISNPAAGLMVYQTDGFVGFWYFNGSAWVQSIGVAGTTGATGPVGSFPAGNAVGDMNYWNGSEWVMFPGGNYGENLFFCNGTPSWGGCLPVVTTDTASSVTTNSAVSGGNVTNEGGLSVSDKGICYSSAPNPTLSNNVLSSGSGLGNFAIGITGLNDNTTYYVRAYATNNKGTAYGNEINFTTSEIQLPAVATVAASSISTTSATAGGNVINDGGASIIARGVCYSTSPNPTVSNQTVSGGTGTGSFSVSLTGLTLGTTYYMRAYATNSKGTAYGSQETFTTQTFVCGVSQVSHGYNASVTPSTDASFANRSYSTVVAHSSWGGKCWLKMNLGATAEATASSDSDPGRAGWFFRFGSPQATYFNGSTKIPNYWPTSVTGSTDWTSADDPCTILLASGWRVPTKTEWDNYRSASTANGGYGASNNLTIAYSSYLKLHGAGYIDESTGTLQGPGTECDFWSQTQYSSSDAYRFNAMDASAMAERPKARGYSLRCIKD